MIVITNTCLGQINHKPTNFIVKPFLPHLSHTKYYVCINSSHEGDSILFTHQGGIDVGNIDAKALKLDLLIRGDLPSHKTVDDTLLKHVPEDKKETLVDFLLRLYCMYDGTLTSTLPTHYHRPHCPFASPPTPHPWASSAMLPVHFPTHPLPSSALLPLPMLPICFHSAIYVDMYLTGQLTADWGIHLWHGQLKVQFKPVAVGLLPV